MADGPNAKRRRRDVYREDGALTPREWVQIKERYNHCCAYCGADGPLEKDHVTPISKGGTHTADNVVPACSRCNRSKANKSVGEWQAEQARHRLKLNARKERRRRQRELRRLSEETTP